MNAPLKVTIGTLAAAALVGIGMLIGKTWSNSASDPNPGPNLTTEKSGAGARSAPEENPMKARYRATTTFKVNQNSAPDIFGTISDDLRGTMSANWLEAQFKSLTARKTLILTVKNLKLDTAWKRSPADAASRLTKLIKADHERGTDIFTLTAWSDKAEEAATIANGVRDAYEQQRMEAQEERLRRLSQNVSSQIKLQEATVEKSRLERLELMKKHNIVDDAAYVAAKRQKQSEYTTGKNRYESQLLLLNTLREHAERQVGETGSRNPIEILEAAVAVEDL